MGAVLPPKFDALDPGVLDDPYPVYARLRAAGPLCRVSPASWGVTRHAEVAALLRDPRLGNEFPQDDPQFRMGEDLSRDVFRRIMPTRPPAEHGRLHRQVVRAFSPGVARGMRERIGRLVDELLAPAAERGGFDAVADLAFPLAVTVVCELIGIPPEVRTEMWPRAVALGKAFTPFLPEGDRAEADAALAWLRGHVAGVLARRRPDPEGDLLSRMLAAADDPQDRLDATGDPPHRLDATGDPPDREEILDNVVFLCFTGFETTMNMVCTGCLGLAAHPEQWRRLRADRGLAQTAVEEFVRFDAPIQYTARLALAPIEVGDRTIRPGRSVFLMVGSANHDERVFADPGRLDIGRRPNPHVGFGGGVRGCLGAVLARTEGGVVFERLAERFATVEPAGPAVRARSALFRSYSSIPLAAKPG